MTLSEQLGVGDRELVAFVGAGGKSTLLFRLGEELGAAGRRVLLTTTTKMGSDQAKRVRTVAPGDSSAGARPAMVVAADDGHKVTGPPPQHIDELFASAGVDYVLVEADGARGRSFKTPAAHEPVIPAATTLVVIVVGMDAIDQPIAERCHRPELVARLAGCNQEDVLDVDRAVRVLTHPGGFFASIPSPSRVCVALTKSSTARAATVDELAATLTARRPDISVAVIATPPTSPEGRPHLLEGNTPL